MTSPQLDTPTLSGGTTPVAGATPTQATFVEARAVISGTTKKSSDPTQPLGSRSSHHQVKDSEQTSEQTAYPQPHLERTFAGLPRAQRSRSVSGALELESSDVGSRLTSTVHAPQPRLHAALRAPIMEDAPRRELTAEHLSTHLASDPPSPNRNVKARKSGSPARPHISALSPLQAFSPLQSMSHPGREGSAASSEKGASLSRSSSVTRSLSRRQSLIAHAAMWDASQEYTDENEANPMTLFSRLTLVRAPSTKLRRAKSSSALAPFAGQNALPDNAPATSARPRRSFAASSFSSFTPMAKEVPPSPFSPPSSHHRLSHLAGVGSGGEGFDYHHAMLTPQEIVDMARDTTNPIVADGVKGADLRRRKSSGSASRRSFGSGSHESPEKPPMELEPVEYVQLDDDTLLPYVERPEEVKELLDHPSNRELVKLLKAAFPKEPLRQHWIALGPDSWNWDEFMKHLTTQSRIECPDYAWVFRARQAVRARSVSLWEKLGTCLGCDGDLLNAGGEDGLPSSWGGLSLGEEGEYDPSGHQVYIEALEAMDPDKMEQQFREEFGEIVEDEGEQAAAGMTALLGTIGEEESTPAMGLTTAQKAAQQLRDPILSPVSPKADLRAHLGRHSSNKDVRPTRSKSFVGLQIMTGPSSTTPMLGMARSPSATTPMHGTAALPVFDRGPGSPLFPGSFSSLSAEPNLGRSASVIAGGVKPAAADFGHGHGRWSLRKRHSGAGLSESAITFASESDPGHGEPGDDVRDRE